ncbi:MAG: hypothetical protein OEV44_08000 [Spirochaetota bacterium]|nr:hypothetical protein [Spirochaetota bacterium]
MHVLKDYSTLNKLRLDNKFEFRYQILSELKRISCEKNIPEFNNLLNQFKKEFINDSYFFIDQLNETIKNLMYAPKEDLKTLYNQFIFLAQLGDIYTLNLLKKIISLLNKRMDDTYNLEKAIENLENRLRQFEKEFDSLKLYPMIDIFDQWME